MNRVAFDRAWTGLLLLDTHLGQDERGNLQGVDELAIAFDNLGASIADICSDDEGDPPLAEFGEVVAYLVERSELESGLDDHAAELVGIVRRASYETPSDEVIERAERLRQRLHEVLSEWLQAKEVIAS